MRYLMMLGIFVLGILVAVPSASVASPNASPVVVAEDEGGDLLMHPSRLTAGASRLGSVEIMNPPHESFGMMQKPSGPDENDIRRAPSGAPVVSGPQAKANAAAVHAERAAAAGEPGGIEAPSPAEAAAQAAAAQAAGVQAAKAQAVTSLQAQSANQAPAEVPPAAPSPTEPAPGEKSPGSTAPTDTPADQGPGQPSPVNRGPDEPAPTKAPPADQGPPNPFPAGQPAPADQKTK